MTIQMILVFFASLGATQGSSQQAGSFDFSISQSASSAIVSAQSNPNNVMSDPSVTILTHGMGGDCTHWIPLEFPTSQKSSYLPFNLSNTTPITDVYLFGYGSISENGVSLVNFSAGDSLYKYVDQQGGTTKAVPYGDSNHPSWNLNLSTHSVFVYNSGINDVSLSALQTAAENRGITGNPINGDVVLSTYFADAVDSLLNMYQLKLGLIPKINLIGHSRGGITNLLYTMDHPNVVANLISIGTPYCGSGFANLMKDLYLFLGDQDKANAYAELANISRFSQYASQWATISGQYNISTYAIGCKQTMDYFADVLMDTFVGLVDAGDDFYTFMDIIQTSISSTDVGGGIVTKASLLSLLSTISVAGTVVGWFGGDCGNLITICEDLMGLVQRNYLVLGGPSGSDLLLDDTCVELLSQSGTITQFLGNSVSINYGFDVCWILKNLYNPYSLAAVPSAPKVVHNTETKDPEVISAISSRLSQTSGIHVHHLVKIHEHGSFAEYYLCSCGAETVHQPLSHTFQTYDATNHLYQCECGATGLLPHVLGPATKIDSSEHQRTCTKCGYVAVENHDVYVAQQAIKFHKLRCSVNGCTYFEIGTHTYLNNGMTCDVCGFANPAGPW